MFDAAYFRERLPQDVRDQSQTARGHEPCVKVHLHGGTAFTVVRMVEVGPGWVVFDTYRKKHQEQPEVRGRVTFEDGTPFPQGTVILLKQDGEKLVQAQGTIQPDGSFELGVNAPKEGVPAGKYRVLINPGDMAGLDAKVRTGFDKRYTDFDTSGLEFEVKPGKNELPIQLTRRGRAGRESGAGP